MAEKRFELRDILEFEPMFRRYFMNSVEGYKNAALIGTADSSGQTNVAIFNSVVHVGASPPLIGFIHRPVSVPKQTFANIHETGFFTINLINRDMVQKAHQTSARYSPGESEFDATGLTPVWGKLEKAPYVGESPIRFGMRLEEIIPIQVNDTFLVIGRVEEMYLPEEIIRQDGFVDLSEAGIIACSGLDSYYQPQSIGRFEYAKKDQPVRNKL